MGGSDFQRCHESAKVLQSGVLRGQAPEVDGVPGHHGLRGGLLVLAVREGKEARGPAVASIPVLVPHEGIPGAGPAGLGNVTNHVENSKR